MRPRCPATRLFFMIALTVMTVSVAMPVMIAAQQPDARKIDPQSRHRDRNHPERSAWAQARKEVKHAYSTSSAIMASTMVLIKP